MKSPQKGRRFDRDLMQPLMAAVGLTQSLAESLYRLRMHATDFAPVVDRGRPIGILSRSLAEAAERFELEASAGELVAGGAPRVDPEASREELIISSRCVAPAILVGLGRGPILGLIPRRAIRIDLEEAYRPAARDDAYHRRLRRAFSGERSALSRTLLSVASENHLPIHLVGGTVRDLILGQQSRDLDFVVEGNASVIARRLATLSSWHVVTHASFGTATVTTPAGLSADLAGSRRETYHAVAALPEVFPGDLVDDLMRRDVTINSMALRIDGARTVALRDDLGGRRDLGARILRVHHTLSIIEDPTRALRIARLSARLGFTLAPETIMSLRLADRVSALDRLGGERLRREFDRIEGETSPAATLDAMARMGILERIVSGVTWNRRARAGIERLCAGLRSGPLAGLPGLPGIPLLILLGLGMTGNDRMREGICRRFRLTGSARQRCLRIHGALVDLRRSLGRARRRSQVVRLCETAPPEALALAWADAGDGVTRQIEWYLMAGREIRAGVTGAALAAMGLPPGPHYAEILDQIRAARIDGAVRTDRDAQRMARQLVRRKAGRASIDCVDTQV